MKRDTLTATSSNTASWNAPRIKGQYAWTTIPFFAQYSTMGFCWQYGCSCEGSASAHTIPAGLLPHLDLVHSRQLEPRGADLLDVLDVAAGGECGVTKREGGAY